MLTAMNDNVISLLDSLGFGSTGPQDVVIDNFDQWTNPTTNALYSTLCTPCGLDLYQPAEAAA